MFKIISIFLLAFSASARAAALSPDDIVAKADDVRNPQMDYTLEIVVVNYKNGKESRRAEYEVMVKGKERTLVKTISPADERGTLYLMRGHDLWVYLPHMSQPVRIPFQQRLTGDVAIGDIARTNFFGDYHAKLMKEDDRGYFLSLTAASDDVTYGKAAYWVESKTFRPLRAVFYAASGKLLKKCAYNAYENLAGGQRPSQMVMTDAVDPSHKSVVYTKSIKEGPLPEKYFTKDYLKKLTYL